VLQQTFANALGALRRDDRPIEVRPWLYRIAHNVSVNALRRSGRNYEQLDEQYDGVPQPPDVFDRKVRVHQLVDRINELPERQRAAIVAHEIEGRSYEEIARSMGATTPIVRQLVHRARTRLRDACGVVVPTWALRWLVLADARTAGSERVGEAVAGGATGAGLLKAGTALLATGAIATGAGGLVAHSEHARESGRAVAAAQRHAAPERTPTASLQAAAGDPRPASRSHSTAKRAPDTREIAQAPVRHGTEPRDPVRPQRPERHDHGDSPDGSSGPGEGGTIDVSHDGSGDSSGDGSSGSGSDSSAGGSGDSTGDSGGTDSQSGSGSSDSTLTVPTDH
jgi:RNA polymerase sigma factor (sigma-70 family)